MVKLIIGIADLHIPNFKGIDEYTEQLSLLIDDLKEKTKSYNKDEIRIVLLGDLIHNKNNVSNELISLASSFISEIEQIGKVIAIAGNHDLVLTNKSRLDTISTIFQVSKFENSIFLDDVLGFDSGCLSDNNIIWSLFSIYNNYKPLDLNEVKKVNPNKLIIGLFHGNLVGSTLSNGYMSEKGVSTEIFKGCDLALCGDIHKRQVINKFGVPIIYSGSLIQQNFGETVTQHGYTIVKISKANNFEYSFVDFNTDYGFYAVELNSIDDIDKDKEKLLNYQ